MKRKKQRYNARLDESLGEREGAERHFRQSLKDRRDESKGMEKAKGHRAYGSLGEEERERLRHHMKAAHHKFMAAHHRRKSGKR